MNEHPSNYDLVGSYDIDVDSMKILQPKKVRKGYIKHKSALRNNRANDSILSGNNEMSLFNNTFLNAVGSPKLMNTSKIEKIETFIRKKKNKSVSKAGTKIVLPKLDPISKLKSRKNSPKEPRYTKGSGLRKVSPKSSKVALNSTF